MRIAIGSDHRGFALKDIIKEDLKDWGHEVGDFGCREEAPVDYPDIARSVGEAVASNQYDLGILVCSNGVGMSIAANKIKGIRAALCHEPFTARRARQHTDANVLCLGAWTIGRGAAEEVVRAFIEGEFEGGRHAHRLEKIRALEGD